MLRETDDYRLVVDEHRWGDLRFYQVHFKVKRFSPGILKQMHKEWGEVRSQIKGPLFAIAENADERWEKFITSFGFKFLMPVTCNNGAERPMWVHYDRTNLHH